MSFSACYFGPYRKQKWRNVNQMPAWRHTQGNVPVTHRKKSQFCLLVFQFCPSFEVKQGLINHFSESTPVGGGEHTPAPSLLLGLEKRSQYLENRLLGLSLADRWEWLSPFCNTQTPSLLVSTMPGSPWSCWDEAMSFSSGSVSSCIPQLMQMARDRHSVSEHGDGARGWVWVVVLGYACPSSSATNWLSSSTSSTSYNMSFKRFHI